LLKVLGLTLSLYFFFFSIFLPTFYLLLFFFCIVYVCVYLSKLVFEFFSCFVHIRLLDLRFKFCSIFAFLGFLGKDLRTHNLAYAHKTVLACEMPLPRNPKFLFVCFVSTFTCLFCLPLFICFSLYRFLFTSFVCLFAITFLD